MVIAGIAFLLLYFTTETGNCQAGIGSVLFIIFIILSRTGVVKRNMKRYNKKNLSVRLRNSGNLNPDNDLYPWRNSHYPI